jgi:hypothetical protein
MGACCSAWQRRDGERIALAPELAEPREFDPLPTTHWVADPAIPRILRDAYGALEAADWPLAAALYSSAIELLMANPRDAVASFNITLAHAHINLSVAFARMQRTDDALRHYALGVTSWPTAQRRIGLARRLEDKGFDRLAVDVYATIIESPQTTELMKELARARCDCIRQRHRAVAEHSITINGTIAAPPRCAAAAVAAAANPKLDDSAATPTIAAVRVSAIMVPTIATMPASATPLANLLMPERPPYSKPAEPLPSAGAEVKSFTPASIPSAASRNECRICMSSEMTHMFAPCNHLCACSKCAAAILITTRKCPICRTAVRSVVRVYSA